MKNDFDHITAQLDKTRFQPRTGRWTTLPELQLVDDFTDDDVTPDQPQASDLSFSTIRKQVNKKGVSKKSKKERIADVSVKLAEHMDFKIPK